MKKPKYKLNTKKPTHQELADDLGISPHTVKNWDARKRDLIIKGLWFEKEYKHLLINSKR